MKTTVPLILVLAVSAGCGSWLRDEPREPFTPASNKSDLVFLRTGDRSFYYIVDKKRNLCFFHGTLYGKKHLAEIDCQKIPEWRRVAGLPDAPPADPGAPGPGAPPADPGAPPPVDPGGVPPAAPPGPPLTTADRESFRRAWVQYFCARRTGTDESLDAILGRHGLDQDRWNRAKDEFSRDKALLSALQDEARRVCP